MAGGMETPGHGLTIGPPVSFPLRMILGKTQVVLYHLGEARLGAGRSQPVFSRCLVARWPLLLLVPILSMMLMAPPVALVTMDVGEKSARLLCFKVKPKKCKYPKGQYGKAELSNNQLGSSRRRS